MDEKFIETLKKAVFVVHQEVDNWQACAELQQGRLSSLANFCEQHQACTQADISSLSLPLPADDVKKRVLYQISQNIESELEEVHSALNKFSYIYQKIKKTKDAVFRSHMNMDKVKAKESDICLPAAAEIMEWLEEADKLVLQQLKYNEHLVNNFRYNDGTVVLLQNSWLQDDTKVFNKLKDISTKKLKDLVNHLPQRNFFGES